MTVIETKMLLRGRGTNLNPSRFVVEYWTLDGRRLAEADKYAGDTIDRLEEAISGLEFRLRRSDEQRRSAKEERDQLLVTDMEHEKEIAKLKGSKKRATKRVRAKTATKKKTTTKKKAGRR